jgi:ankyrin repeat protein
VGYLQIGFTALTIALEQDQKAAALFLIRHGATLHHKNNVNAGCCFRVAFCGVKRRVCLQNGQTLLEIARAKGFKSVVAAMEEKMNGK